jgi:uncharacterized protein
MKIRAVVLAFVMCLTSLELLGQAGATSGSDSPASREDVRKMLDVMHVRDQMKLVMEQVAKQVRSVESDQIRRQQPNVTDDDMAKLDAISNEVMKSIPLDGLLDDMVPVYQKHLNKSDVDAMIGFYSTPTGQKILREMPDMTREGMEAMQPRLRQMMDQANARIEKMLDEQMQEKKHDPSSPNTDKD